MDAVKAILTRRSVRRDAPGGVVAPDVIEVVLRCGRAAPSSKNTRPWELHVVSTRDVLGAIAEDMSAAEGADRFVPLDPATGQKRDWESTVEESAATLRSASLAIFVENRGVFSRSRRAVASVPPELVDDALIGYALEMIGHGAAIENMWIAATALGLAASFMGDVLVAEDQVKRRLGFVGDLVGALALRPADPASPGAPSAR